VTSSERATEPSHAAPHARTCFTQKVRLPATACLSAAFALARSSNSPTIAPPSRSASSTPAPSHAALLQRHIVNVHSTALVVVQKVEKTFDTAAFIDPCTPTSSIDASLAPAICLPAINVGDESICMARIRLKVDGAIKLVVVLQIEPNVCIRSSIEILPSIGPVFTDSF